MTKPSPVIIATWPFGVAACRAGWQRLREGANALDTIEAAANVTELDPEVSSVGYGGRPNADGIVELDAAIMDGKTHSAGAVAALTEIRTPISVARRVMERTPHVMLAGANARKFAEEEGFPIEELLTEESARRWHEWRGDPAGPDVAHFEIGPRLTSSTDSTDKYTDKYREPHGRPSPHHTPESHDTIGLCALDVHGDLAAGCTTSGMAWKIPGRVGDSPIIGSGLYVDNEIGAAAATGHGDEMMKACLSYRVVLEMGRGLTPEEACIEALRYLLKKRPTERHDNYGAGIIALRKDGLYAGVATLSGFAAPNALWQWAVATGSPSADHPQSHQQSDGESEAEVVLHQGPYVTSETITQVLV